MFKKYSVLLLLAVLFSCRVEKTGEPEKVTAQVQRDPEKDNDTFRVIYGTYLGSETRNYYGTKPPGKLNLIWKYYLGAGYSDNKHGESVKWAGTGWTGQPLLTEENGKLYIYIGALDYHLKKIDSEDGTLVWQYKYDDAIKGTGHIFINSKAETEREKYSVVLGSKRGYGKLFSAKECYSLRSVSMLDGRELWRYNVEQTRSASRDVDGTPISYNDTIAAPLENGYFVFLNPNNLSPAGKFYTPEEIAAVPLFSGKTYRRNLIAEGSPTILDNIIYNTCGSGSVYGINKSSRETVFEYNIGADLNGTSPVTNDGCLLVSIEKEYISGSGGIMKIDPSIEGDGCVKWFFPAGNRTYGDWNGGVIGSPVVYKDLCAFMGIDGWLYLLSHKRLTGDKTAGPDRKNTFPSPLLHDKYKTGPSISTPLIIEDKIISCGYNGVFLFKLTGENKLELTGKFTGGFESTPVCYNNKIYIGSRDGYLYCLGDN